MRAIFLIPILLLGSLPTAFPPAASPDVFGAPPRITDIPVEPRATPAECNAALQRLAEAVQQQWLPADGKLLKTFLAPAPASALAVPSGASRIDLADRAEVLSPLALPRNPRAPPASPRA